MTTKPTLVVLAAGMGSRYGGLKQMDAFGPSGETIIDYSLYDAIDAGFGKIVFIIREFFKEEFITKFDPILKGKVEVAYVTQEIDNVPDGITYPKDRIKPWGTGHALWVTRQVVNEPFGVINSDDFYGRDAIFKLAGFLANTENTNYAVVAYKLNNTLSDHGTVNRGVCSSDNGLLVNVVECIKIGKVENEIYYLNPEGAKVVLDKNTLVSMNMWGFTPSFLDATDARMGDFFRANALIEKSELYIPTIVDELIKSKEAVVEVIETDSNWFGVTYPEDKPFVAGELNKLIEQGVYKRRLWS